MSGFPTFFLQVLPVNFVEPLGGMDAELVADSRQATTTGTGLVMEEPLDVALEDVCNFLGGAPDRQQPGAYGTGTASSNLGNVLQDAAVFQSLQRANVGISFTPSSRHDDIVERIIRVGSPVRNLFFGKTRAGGFRSRHGRSYVGRIGIDCFWLFFEQFVVDRASVAVAVAVLKSGEEVQAIDLPKMILEEYEFRHIFLFPFLSLYRLWQIIDAVNDKVVRHLSASSSPPSFSRTFYAGLLDFDRI